MYQSAIIASVVLIVVSVVSYNYDVLLWVGVALLSTFYVVYLIDTFIFNANLKYLSKVGLVNGIQNHMAKVKQAIPVIIWHMTYYQDEASTGVVHVEWPNMLPNGTLSSPL